MYCTVLSVGKRCKFDSGVGRTACTWGYLGETASHRLLKIALGTAG